MQTIDVISLLNRVLRLASRSLASYLVKASEPLLEEKGKKEFATALSRVDEAEAGHVEAIEQMILDLGGVPDPGSFEMRTAYYNYLSADYVIGLMKVDLRKIVAELDSIAAQLSREPGAHAAVKAVADGKREELALLDAIKLPERKAEMAVKPKITPPFPPAKKPAPAAGAAPAGAAPTPAPGAAAPKPA